MLASAKRLLTALTLVSSCTGTIEGLRTDLSSAEGDDDGPRVSDAGTRRDAGRDASRVSDDDDGDDGFEDAAGPETRNVEGVGFKCGTRDEPPHARGLKLREIALYQTVKSTLYQGGAWLGTPSVPVVQNKQALVRAFVDMLPGYTRHAVRGVLTLETAQGSTVLTDERIITAASSDTDPASTFSFEVKADKLGPGTKLSLALQETDCDAEPGSAKDARAPEQGTQGLVADAYGKLRIVLVPIDLGGRLPQTSDAEVEKMRAFMLAYYPVPEVEITVRERPLVWSGALRGTDGRAWSDLLSAIVSERRADAVGSEVYYYGLVQPGATFGAYCASGCILGIAPQATRVTPSMQVALGASFGDNQSYETMVHEVGHAHGRGHAPCARGGTIDGVDTTFPDKTGATATWGWDNRTSKLLPPNYKDIMGYCQPNWISAYTYTGLAERTRQVSQRAFIQAPLVATRWHALIAHEDGSGRWSRGIETDTPGELEPASVRDASGREIAQIQIARVPLADTRDEFVFVPEPGAAWHTLVFGGRTLALGSIAPPL
jgi:hypothetical protein